MTSSHMIEKAVIFVSLLVACPLCMLDKDVLGFRRYAWLVAFITGMTVHLVLGPLDEMSTTLDRITMAALSITTVPHVMTLLKDSPWLGMAMVPPIFVVLHMSIETGLDSQDYWRLRAFLHMAVFILPYLNHLPSGEEPEAEDGTTDGNISTQTMEKKTTPAAGAATPKSKKASKYKNKKN